MPTEFAKQIAENCRRIEVMMPHCPRTTESKAMVCEQLSLNTIRPY